MPLNIPRKVNIVIETEPEISSSNQSTSLLRSLKVVHGYRLAAASLLRDGPLLVPLMLVLALPSIFRTTLGQGSTIVTVICSLVDVALEAAALIYVFQSYVNAGGGLLTQRLQGIFPRLFGFGTLFWLLTTVPAVVASTSAVDILRTVASYWLILGFTLSILFYFYFVPVIIGGFSFYQVLERSRLYIKADRILPFRAFILPSGLALVITGILLSSGDGLASPHREASWIQYLSDLSFGLEKLLKIYLSIAFAFVFMQDEEQKRLSVNYHHLSSTLLNQVRPKLRPSLKWLSSFLTLRHGVMLLLLGAFVWSSNLSSAQRAPFPATVQDISHTTGELLVRVKLSLKDTAKLRDAQGNLEILVLEQFSLATKDGAVIAKSPAKILVNGAEVTSAAGAISATDPLTLELEFSTTRSQQQIEKLSNLSLWYRQAVVKELWSHGAVPKADKS